MSLRSRIPTRRAAAGAGNENRLAGGMPAAHATGKHTEAAKASLRPRAASTIGAASGKSLHAAQAKPLNGKPMAKIAARLHTLRTSTRLARPGQSSLPKPPLGNGPRVRQGGGPMRPSTAAPRPSSIVGARPISKPVGTSNSRRLRTTSSSSLDVGLPSKRVKTDEATRNLVPSASSLLGKHGRSGVRTTGHHVAAATKLIERAHSETYDETEELELEPERARKIGNYGQQYHRRTYSSDAEMESVATTVNSSSASHSDVETSSVLSAATKTASPAVDASLTDLKFVDEDAIDYALVHTGELNEQPITMEEINGFEADVDPHDTSLIPEYGDDIFGYMRELEVKLMPDPNYMDRQHALSWSMRSILIDWLVQVHERFNLLPESLCLSINLIDRFLSTKEVTVNRLQLVGAVSLLLAAKYEETRVPSISDIIFMVENTYSADEIKKAERYLLRTLNFDLGWPGPLSYLRRISKANDYDAATRTLAKYLVEVTLIDERFIGVPSSKVAAVAHYLSMRFLGQTDWSRAHVFYAGYFESELLPLAQILVDLLMHPRRHRSIYEKYSERRYMHASSFVYQWFTLHEPDTLLVPLRTDLKPSKPQPGDKKSK
ncbi:B-type cyclin [Linderina pennispora]|nr:B-type cyclin [Linderina pennispora]